MSQFVPTIWPEEITSAEAANCQKCELAKQRKRVIWGEGNPSAPVFVVLDNPGAREDTQGVEFLCGTRQTLQTAVHEVGLQMEHIYVSYILKCRSIRSYDKDFSRSTCMPYLTQQIEEKVPKIVACLGNVAVQSYFQNPEAEVKSMRGKVWEKEGIPTVVSYHPLAVRRRPNLKSHFIQDWELIRSLKSCLEYASIQEAQGSETAEQMVQSTVNDFSALLEELKEGMGIAEQQNDETTGFGCDC